MIAILADLGPHLTPLPGVLAVSPNRTPEILFVGAIIVVAAVVSAIALRK